MPYLVTVTGNRVALRRGHSYLLGRGSDCDIVVEDSACSRQHARITVAQTSDTAFVEDLSSRNGTFLSGERVGIRAAARDGTRLQVGASVFLVRLSGTREEVDLAETGTIAFDQQLTPQDTDGGELKPRRLLEVLNRVFNAKRNLTVHVALPGEHARIEVRDGEVVAAECGGLEGFNALVKLGRQDTGIFWLAETDQGCERNVHEHGVRLLADLTRCLDPASTRR